MYTDLCLKFNNEDEAKAVLFINTVDDEGTVLDTRPVYQNIDIIGVIWKDEIQQDGWHVNVRLTDTEDGEPLQPYVVVVNTPHRVWA